MLSAYLQGWKTLLNNKRLWLLLYALNLCFAALIAFPLSSLLEKTFAYNLSLRKGLAFLDYTLVMDFLNNYGKSIAPIIDQSLVMLLLFFLLSVFITGGILNHLIHRIKGDQSLSFFWAGGGKYFWRIFRLSIYFLLLQMGLLFLIWKLFIMLSGGLSPFGLQSDEDWVYAFKIVAPIYLLFVPIIMLIHDTAKVHMVHQNRLLLFRPFWQTFGIIFKNFISFFLLYLLNLLTFLAFFGLYYILKNLLGSHLLVLLILGQLFLLVRIGMKFLNLGSLNELYEQRV